MGIHWGYDGVAVGFQWGYIGVAVVVRCSGVQRAASERQSAVKSMHSCCWHKGLGGFGWGGGAARRGGGGDKGGAGRG